MHTTTAQSPMAIAGGFLAASGATALLVKDAAVTGWTVDHALMPVLVGLTCLCGHLFWRAVRDWKPISALGLALLAVLGSGLTVYETMGRRADARDAKVMTVEDAQKKRTANVSSLQSLRQTLNLALPSQTLECAGAPHPVPPSWPECRRKTAHVEALQAQIASLDVEVEKVKPAPIDAKAERVAALAQIWGWNTQTVKGAVATFEPFAFPLFLELAAIVLFGFGVGHGRKDERPDRKPDVSAITEREDPITDAEIEELKRILKLARRPMTNGEIAERMSVSKAEASKRVAKGVAAGLVSKGPGRNNREVAIQLH